MSTMAEMSGPEHFRAGEHALQQSEEANTSNDFGMRLASLQALQAQAHFAAAQSAAWALLAASEAAVDVVEPAKVWAELFGIDTTVTADPIDPEADDE